MADNGDIAGGLFAVVYDDSYDGGAWLGAFFIGGGENVIEIVAIAGFVVGIGVVSGAGVASSVKKRLPAALLHKRSKTEILQMREIPAEWAPGQ